MRGTLWLSAVCAVGLALSGTARAQDTDGALSQAEIESLRDAAYVPMDRVRAYESILDTREKEIGILMKRGRRPGFVQDMHDELDQFGAIADELNDNLDEFDGKHRDLRKELPRLMQKIERWQTVLRGVGDDDGYNVVRKIALTNLADMKTLTADMEGEQERYFKEHPEAARAEKDRLAAPHAPTDGPPR